jgi:hypothetical protein
MDLCAEAITHIRLSGGTKQAGRLEVRLGNGLWGSVCRTNPNTFEVVGDFEGEVACRNLGFSSATVLDQPTESAPKPVLRGIVCQGVEARLTDCKLVPGNQTCSSVVGLRCGGG